MKNMRKVKYKIYTNANNDIIAVSTYAGKVVKGVAKCDPRDTFDFETGKKIAEARCAKKIADKREKRAREKYQKAQAQAAEAVKYLEKMENYLKDSCEEVAEAEDALEQILSEV